MRTIAILALTLMFALIACSKTGDSAGAAKDEPAKADVAKGDKAESADDSMFPGFNAQAEMKALQGTWKVKDSAFGKEPALWTLAGKKLTVTKGDKKEEGELAMDYPGELAFVKKSGGGTSKSYFAYARNDTEVYIGLGTGGLKSGENFMVGDDGVVVLKGKACKYYKKKMFGGFENAVDVKCEVKADGDKQVFSYQIPDRLKKGQMSDRKVGIFGSALLNQQMTGHKAEKVQ